MNQEAKLLLGIGATTLIILVAAAFFLNQPQQAASSKPADPSLLIRSYSHQSETTPTKVTIVEFGDYQCPACGQAYPSTKQVLKDYAGKVNIVFRNFPLSQHQNALLSAEAAEAAAAQGKFWQMHDKLYETQSEWSESRQPLDQYISFAKELGLDTNKFKEEVTSNKYDNLIKDDQTDGTKLGVDSTPTFYVNGQKLNGYDYQSFKTRIEEILNK
jgi:protein-disulfide isomerase